MSDKDSKDMSEMFQKITGQESVTESQKKNDKRLRGDESDSRPTTSEKCPECGHEKSYYEMKQIRSADESETRFFECVECGYKWREDDH